MRPLSIALAALLLGACSCGDESVSAKSELTVTPTDIDLGSGPPSAPLKYVFKVSNTGQGTLKLEGTELVAGDPLAWFADLEPKALETGAVTYMTVTFTSATVGVAEATLRVRSDAASRPTVDVHLTAEVLPPIVSAECKAGCKSPPAASCVNATTARSYAAAGTCEANACTYPPLDADCSKAPDSTCASATSVKTFSAGTCDSGACKFAETVTACNTPPQSACASATKLTTYGAGSCAAGKCAYASAEVDCAAAKAPVCATSTTVKSFSAGACDSGACKYTESVSTCPQTPPAATCTSTTQLKTYGVGGCNNGTCGFPENLIDCAKPPANTCASSTTAKQYSAGTCAAGACSYPETLKDCVQAPAAVCADATTLKRFSGGTCAGGDCSYPATLESCDVPPPSPVCASSTSVKTFGPGRCASGACGFAETVTTCNTPPNGCFKAAGTCNAGKCEYAFNDGAACNDGISCTTGDVCSQGKCAGTPPLTSGYQQLAANTAVQNASRLDLSGPFDVWTIGDNANGVAHWDGCSYTRCANLPATVGNPNAACWQDDPANSPRLRAVTSLAAGKFLAVGDKGLVALSGASTCYVTERVPNPPGYSTPPHLTGVWAASETDVFAVGHMSCDGESFVLERTDTGWKYLSKPSLPAGATLYSVTGRAANEVYVTGSDATVNAIMFGWDGNLWGQVTIPAIGSLNSVHAPRGTNLVYGAGYDTQCNATYGCDNPVLIVWDGASWARWDKASGKIPTTYKNFGRVYVAPNGTVYVSSNGKDVYAYNGAGWSTSSLPLTNDYINDMRGSQGRIFMLVSPNSTGLWRGP